MAGALEAKIDAWLAAVRQDPECRAASEQMPVEIEFDFGRFERVLRLEAAGAATEAVRLRLKALVELWQEILSPMPSPGCHSFTALQRQRPEFKIDGDALAIARALHFLERALEIGRGSPAGAATAIAPPEAALAQVVGRHALVQSRASRARIFYEQAGQGIPLVMLHTAGADSRQYLDLLTTSSLTGRWSCYAFDMPLHGRSSPPEDWEWGSYRLSMTDYLGWCLAFIEQVVGQPAVVMGCSMGASISIALAASGSELVRAVVALEAPDKSPGRRNPYLNHPAVNSSDYDAAYVRGLMSPTSPLAKRREASWIYAQGGPGVYPGDLWFYSEEYDGLALAPRIDTSRCPVYMLTGAYDYSSPPAASRRLCEAIAGARLEVMPDLGHFPMTENPARFLEYATPVLDELQQRLEASSGR
jgi:pimeloyl-ACP methyl ester carboxylesterase